MNKEKHKFMKIKNNPKGITLIALIITVVVMLILAGVAISVLVDGDGLFTKTRQAADEYKTAAEEEAAIVSDLISEIDQYLSGVPSNPGGNEGEEGENPSVPETPQDTTVPTVATLEVTEKSTTEFTLQATGQDETGIVKYEFYVDDMVTPYETVKSKENTVMCEVTERTPNKIYKCKVIVYDAANNSKASEIIEVATGVTAEEAGIEIGHYVNYKAGNWTEADLTKITTQLTLDDGTTVTPSVHATVRTATSATNTTLPDTQGQFGGFVLGQSRDTNSKEYNAGYKPDASGWRVWDISGNTITLISAGHPETYRHNYNTGSAQQSVEILKKRDWTMYENQFAQANSAHVLTGQEAKDWYNARFGTNYTVIENGGSDSTFFGAGIVGSEPVSVLDNNSYYWLATGATGSALYNFDPSRNFIGNNANHQFGVRILVSLKSDVCFEEGTGDGSVGSPWKIVGQE